MTTNLPQQIITVGKYCFQCFGILPEKRRIVVEDRNFLSLFQLTQSFPELLHHPSALAQCANFLFMGDTFRVITDPMQFQNNYFASKQSHVDFKTMHSPRFEKNDFVFYAWNEVNDLPYRVTCAYPFTNSHNEIKYELLQ